MRQLFTALLLLFLLVLLLNISDLLSSLRSVSDGVVQQKEYPQNHHKKYYFQLVTHTFLLRVRLFNPVMGCNQLVYFLNFRKRQTRNFLSQGLRGLQLIHTFFGVKSGTECRCIAIFA